MSKKKDVVINVEPFTCDMRTYEKGFTLQFMSDMGNGRKKIINVKLERWWVIYIARLLKKVIKSEQVELDRIVDLTGFRDSE